MGYTSLALRTSGFTIANASASIVAGANPVRLLEMTIHQATATAQSLGLGFPATEGTPTTPVLFQKTQGEAASLASGYLTWSAQPTAPAVYLRRWNSAAAIGENVRWEFHGGLVIPAGLSLVLWNITTAVAVDVNFVLYE